MRELFIMDIIMQMEWITIARDPPEGFKKADTFIAIRIWNYPYAGR
jgi:hypothetical protein